MDSTKAVAVLLAMLAALVFPSFGDEGASAVSLVSADTATYKANNYYPNSFFKKKIPSTATYKREYRIGSLRPNADEWSSPIYRTATNPSDVKVIKTYDGSIRWWPIPTSAKPATGSDHHMSVISKQDGSVYEFFNAKWSSGKIYAESPVKFSTSGSAVSSPTYFRVNAAGWSTMAGMLIKEDFMSSSSAYSKSGFRINHALAILLPFDMVQPYKYVSPAVGGERLGTNSNGVPMGARFALPRSLNVDSLSVHPVTRELARALRDYGGYVIDTNGAPDYRDKASATVRIENGMIQKVYGRPNDMTFRNRIQSEMYSIISKHGLYRVYS